MQHPDEGTIHAWLDGALSAAESRAIEAHVAECAECASAVSEARGLLAASSRILSALDTVPGRVIPEGAAAAPLAPSGRWRPRWSSAPWRAAAALVLVGSVSLMLTRSRETEPRDARSARTVAVAADTAQLSAAAKPALEQGSSVAVATGAPAPVIVPHAAPARSPARTSGPRAESLLREEIAAAPSAQSVDAMADRAASPPPAASSGYSANYSSATAPAAGAQSRIAAVPRIVIDHAYVDSVLAADSAEVTGDYMLPRLAADAGSRAVAKSSRGAVNAPGAAPSAAPTVRLRGTSGVLDAVGCYTIDTLPWSPRLTIRDTTASFLPARVELRADRGTFGDEAGELLLRPAPGEPDLEPGTAALWKPIGRNKVRLMIGDQSRWITLTVAITADSLDGRARAWSAENNRLRTTTVRGRRVVCRTEP